MSKEDIGKLVGIEIFGAARKDSSSDFFVGILSNESPLELTDYMRVWNDTIFNWNIAEQLKDKYKKTKNEPEDSCGYHKITPGKISLNSQRILAIYYLSKTKYKK